MSLRMAIACVVLIGTFCGCRPDEAVSGKHEHSLDMSVGQQHIPDEWFEQKIFQILDDATSLPVVGAKVHVVCLGGTPYQNSNDVTDENGIANVTHWHGDLTPVSIDGDGYEPATFFVNEKHPVVRLKRRLAPTP